MNLKLSTVFTILLVLALGYIEETFANSLQFNYLRSFGRYGIGKEQYDDPVDIVKDIDNETLYILDQGNYRVQKVNYKGDFITEWGRRGFGDGEFRDPRSIGIDSENNIYVVDTGNHRIQKFSADGDFILSFGKLGSSKRGGFFRYPTDITFDRDQNIYIADAGNNRVVKYTINFDFIHEWGRFNRQGRELNNPFSLAYSDDGFGHIYVADGVDCRIQKYDREGNLKKEWGIHKPGRGLLCGPVKMRVEQRKYHLYIADIENDIILIFDRNGELIGELKEGDVKFKRPSGLFVNDTVELLVVDTGNNRIHKFRR